MWKNELMYRIKLKTMLNSIQLMQTKAENLLNPYAYHLSETAKKRLRWMYIIYYESDNNVTLAANKIGISREWLSRLKSKFERNHKNPRSLEPASKAPHNTLNRQRISEETEEKILEIRDEYGWGKEDIAVVLKRDYSLQASPSTVNRYLHRHLRIDPKISERNRKAWAEKKLRDQLKSQTSLKVKYRPPTQVKDYAPGALIEKDMKLVPTIGKTPLDSDKYHLKDHFNYQHTFLDSFTRIRVMELAGEPDSEQARQAYKAMKKRMPFNLAAMNTDSGGENGKDFQEELNKDEIIHFYSRTSSPTDNPRVERSHLTDEREYSRQGYRFKTLAEQKEALKQWEHVYNYIKPHQALSGLTPMEFYKLWKEDKEKAYELKDKYQAYLKKQRQRLANSRRLKRKEQIEKLMNFIDAKLKQPKQLKVNLQPYKLELIKCELCSWT